MGNELSHLHMREQFVSCILYKSGAKTGKQRIKAKDLPMRNPISHKWNILHGSFFYEIPFYFAQKTKRAQTLMRVFVLRLFDNHLL